MSSPMLDQERQDRIKRDDRKDLMPAALLSAGVHVVLFIGLFSVFQWSTNSETVYAELWAPEAISGGNDPQGVAEKLPDPPKPDPVTEDEKRESQEAAEAREREAEEAAAQEAQAREAEALERAEAERAQAEKAAQEAREAEEARREEAARLAHEKAEAERIERARQDAIEAERRAEEMRAQKEAERLAQEKLAEERRAAEEARQAAEARRAEEARIAEEKRLEEERRAEAARIAEAKRQEEARIEKEKRIAEAKRVAAEKKAREEQRERERIRQAIRQQELARLNAQVDPNAARSGSPTGDKRNVRQNLRGSALASYSARVTQCVRENISISVPSDIQRGQYQAEFLVSLLPNGERAGEPRQTQRSGWNAYDQAVRRGIMKCSFPRPDPGYNPPRELRLTFDPVDDRR